ncbi:MAG: VIT1/CCC1 transporter family protein [Candidatus Magasanikbacteria bacterium]
MTIPHNNEYIHHIQSKISPSLLREIVFGLEDGMVSTLGAVTGIATATNSQFTTLLSGFVVISVESISMAVGSYLSNKSEKDTDDRKLYEEREELQKYPEDEKEELFEMYVGDGWPKKMAKDMALIASKDKHLFLKEMAYRELDIITDNTDNPIKKGWVMFASYVVGGSIPLIPYVLFPIHDAVPISIVFTLIGLFVLGIFTTRFTKRKWWKAGLEMTALASLAALIGYFVGQLVDGFLK